MASSLKIGAGLKALTNLLTLVGFMIWAGFLIWYGAEALMLRTGFAFVPAAACYVVPMVFLGIWEKYTPQPISMIASILRTAGLGAIVWLTVTYLAEQKSWNMKELALFLIPLVVLIFLNVLQYLMLQDLRHKLKASYATRTK